MKTESEDSGKRHALPVRMHRKAVAYVGKHESTHRAFFHAAWISYTVHAIVKLKIQGVGLESGVTIVVSAVEIVGHVLGL